MSRSVKKGPYIEPKLLRKVTVAQQTNSRAVIRTWSRAVNHCAGDGRAEHGGA